VRHAAVRGMGGHGHGQPGVGRPVPGTHGRCRARRGKLRCAPGADPGEVTVKAIGWLGCLVIGTMVACGGGGGDGPTPDEAGPGQRDGGEAGEQEGEGASGTSGHAGLHGRTGQGAGDAAPGMAGAPGASGGGPDGRRR